jgi:hypothetical protein
LTVREVINGAHIQPLQDQLQPASTQPKTSERIAEALFHRGTKGSSRPLLRPFPAPPSTPLTRTASPPLSHLRTPLQVPTRSTPRRLS